MKPLLLTPRAERDVSDIWDYIASDNIDAADRVSDALEKVLYKLAKNRGVGHTREELADRPSPLLSGLLLLDRLPI
jgi:toxin ParE1/3/4